MIRCYTSNVIIYRVVVCFPPQIKTCLGGFFWRPRLGRHKEDVGGPVYDAM